MSEYFIIIPLVIIIIAFYFAERHDKNANLLKSLKDFLGKFHLSGQQASQTSQEEEEQRHQQLLQEQQKRQKNKTQVSNKGKKQNSQVKGTLDLTPNDSYKDSSLDSYAKVNRQDYPLNSSVYRQTKHYVPETTYSEDIDIKLDEKLKPSNIHGYQNKDHYTYYFGKDFDHLY